MKLVDKMKDEKLGSALLYNFTKGYGHVPMDLYDIVLPLLFHDLFRKEINQSDSFIDCIKICQEKDDKFIETILKDYENDKEMTSRSLGICLLNQYLSFEVEDAIMKGIVQESQILDLNEAMILGKQLQGCTLDDVLSCLKENDFKIVFLDSETLGSDIDLSCLNRFGEVVVYDQCLKEDISSRIQDAHIVITNKHVLNETVLKDAKKLELICVTATGVNNIDLNYCHQRGITVCNVKDYSTNSVAQHTFALLLDLYDQNHYYHQYMESGCYCTSSMFTHLGHTFHELDGKVWGIVGLGNIGKKVASIAQAFGCRVIYYSTTGENYNSNYQQVDFDTLLKTSDVISIHAPLNDKTTNLFNKDTFAQMKPTSFLINVGRGKIVNEVDLVQALKDNQIAGAGLDVFENEPFFQKSPLLDIQNASKLIMTPHIAWATVEARKRCIDEVCQNIECYKMRKPRNVC